jgi:hypothetical protein
MTKIGSVCKNYSVQVRPVVCDVAAMMVTTEQEKTVPFPEELFK